MEDKKPAGGDFLSRLRSSTAQAHQQLEDIPSSKVLMSDSLTRDQYLHYLLLMYPVMKDVEDNIYPLLNGIIPELDQRRKAGLLLKDIGSLAPGTRVDDDRPFSSGRESFSPDFAAGIMYVTEGSTLGGRVIIKNVSKVLGLNEHSGTAFFSGYGINTGPYWKSFLEALTAYSATKGNEKEMIEGAIFAFDSIYRYFTKTTANHPA